MASSQGAAQITSHYVLTSMPVQPGVHKNLVGAGFASSTADVVCITMFKTLLCCIAKLKLCYDVARSQRENMAHICWCVLLTLLLELYFFCFMQATHDLMSL